MRKLIIAVGVVAALAFASVAVAHGLDAQSVKSVAGTFTATTVSNSSTRSCTNADGKTIDSTYATYTGTATGAPDLTGPVTIRTRSTVDSTDGIGLVNGRLSIGVSGGDTTAEFTSVYDHGNIAGLAVGRAHSPSARVVANLSGAFSTTGGFTNAKLGGGTAGGSAVEVTFARCEQQHPVHERSDAHGTVSAVSSTSITVSGLTCAVPASLAAQLAGLVVGNVATIRCELTSGVNTLVAVRTPEHNTTTTTTTTTTPTTTTTTSHHD